MHNIDISANITQVDMKLVKKNRERALLFLEAFSISDQAGSRNKEFSHLLRAAEVKCLFDS